MKDELFILYFSKKVFDDKFFIFILDHYIVSTSSITKLNRPERRVTLKIKTVLLSV